MSIRRNHFSASFVSIFLLVCQLAFSFDKPGKQAKSIDLASFEINGFKSIEVDNLGNKLWDLYASKAKSYKEKEVYLLYKVKFAFYGDNMIYKVEALTAKIYNNNNNIDLNGEVKINVPEGYSLHTDKLRYFKNKKLFKSESMVYFNAQGDSLPKMTIEGKGFLGNIQSSTFKLNSNVVGKRYMEDQSYFDISSKECVVYLNKNEVSFKDQVGMLKGSLGLNSHDVKMKLKEKSSQIQEIIASGNVSLNQEHINAKSELAKVSSNLDVVTLKGNASITQKGSHVFGDEILYNTKNYKVDVVHAKAKVSSSMIK